MAPPKVSVAAAATALSALALAACGGGAGASAAGDITVASISALSGAATFPESSLAAKAVFDDVNAAGGINR